MVVDGNKHFSDKQVVKHMATRPEGFWWFQKGEYDERKVDQDVRERLPRWYADHGYVDFQVTHDSLVADSAGGKAVLHLTVDEGQPYQVGDFDIEGNRRFSTEELQALYPFGPVGPDRHARRAGRGPFSRSEWDAATEKVQNLYANNGYIYAQVEPTEIRRTGPDGKPVVDLRWTIREGSPATINKVEIVGNDVTHERVIREAIVMLPGDLFSRERLIRSYQNVSNLGFFQQPLPSPDVKPAANGVDVDIIFRVEERRTGNINFGASLGQGTGVGGFLGLEEPNLFGRGKRGKLQWQFGKNINDFTLSYTDPAIRESRISGTVSLFDSRARYTIGDLGRRKQTGGSLQLGFPFLGSRYTRFFTSYSYQRVRYTEGSADLRARFSCSACSRSTLGVEHPPRHPGRACPFATGGSLTNVSGELNGGFLGGTGQLPEGGPRGPLVRAPGHPGRRRAARRRGTVRARPHRQVGIHLRRRRAVLHRAVLARRGAVRHPAPGLRRVLDHAERVRPVGERQPGQPGRLRQVVRRVHGGGRRADQPVALPEHVLRRGQRVPERAPVGSDPAVPRRRLRRRRDLAARTDRVDLGYGFDRVDGLGRPDPGWQLHFKLGNFF